MVLRIITAVFLFVAIACANNTNISCPVDNTIPKEHRGFYQVFSLGFGANAFDFKIKEHRSGDMDDNETRHHEFTGINALTLNARTGASAFNLLALFATGMVDISYGTLTSNSSYLDRKEKHTKILKAKAAAGLGTSIYPFRSPGAMNGFFVGGSALYTTSVMIYESDYFSHGKTFQAELGKDWWIKNQGSIGFALSFTSTTYMSEGVYIDNYDYTIGLSLRFVKG